MTKTATSRNVTVQVPGEAPKAPEQPPVVSGSAPENEGAANVVITKSDVAQIDLEAMRAQIREEERAILRDELLGEARHAARNELAQDIAAARSVVAKPERQQLGRRDYASMHPDDIDPATLTAPVMTRLGYLCPPAPEAKK